MFGDRLRAFGACLVLWVMLGSWSAASAAVAWSNITPEGGAVYEVIFAPGDVDTAYAVTGAGVYRSGDGGQSWSVTADTGNGVIQSMTVLSPDTVLLGLSTGAILRTTDSGATWVDASDGLSGYYVTALTTIPGEANSVLAGTADGLYKSADGGVSWNLLSAVPRRATTLLAIDGATIYAGGSTGVLVTGDGGSNWVQFNDGLVDTMIYRLAGHPTDPATVYAATGAGVFVMVPGIGWIDSYSGMGAGTAYSIAFPAAGQFYAVMADDAMSPGIYRSTDSGSHWNLVHLGPVNVVGASAGSALLAGTGSRGIVRSLDGITWTSANSGLRAATITSLLPEVNGSMLTLVDDYDLFASGNQGASWSQLPNTPAHAKNVVRDPVDPNTLYLATTESMRWSRDGGASWDSFDNYLNGAKIRSFAFDGGWLYGGSVGEGLLRNELADPIWSRLGLDGETVNAVLPRGDLLLAGTNSGIYRSTDAGQNWTFVHNERSSVLLLAADGTYWSAGMGGLARSSDGVSWQLVTGPDSTVTGMALDSRNDQIYVSTYGGVFRRNDDGSWTLLAGGDLGASWVGSIVVDSSSAGATLYAAGIGGGLFRCFIEAQDDDAAVGGSGGGGAWGGIALVALLLLSLRRGFPRPAA